MCGVLPLMEFIMFLFTAIFMFHISSAQETEIEPMSQINLQTYIVYVHKPKGLNSLQSESLDSWYQSLLPVTTASSKQQQRLVYSYQNVVAGFAARLTAQEAKAMEMKEEVAHIRPEEKLFLQTTHSPSFLGLHQEKGFWKDSNFGKGVIIGVLDTGITPGHPSFRDEGMPPPPDRWKGKCEFKQTANGTQCNNKIIGARSFSKVLTPSSTSPIDWMGHGTHTASTAAGNFVKEANLYGNANGTAAGVAPYAHLAIYQVCSVDECSDSDVLAGLDAAIEDGVDVISISMASMNINPLFEDTIALAAFSAMERGIFVACSAGNSGPSTYSVVNAAPWILTVGASTIDRSVIATARLGNRVEFDGESIFQPNFTKGNSPTLVPLVYPGTNGAVWSMICNNGSLGDDVKGKIVLCERSRELTRIEQGKVVNAAGGAAMFLMNAQEEGYSTFAEPHVLPASHLSYAAGLKVKAYIKSTRKPMATVKFKGTLIGNSSAPVVASFSSRGPSMICPGILKPDIIGPGVNILAAWPFHLDKSSKSKSNFNMISGTSMSCPQLSGIAALLKSSHPDWSPAAIKSAIMTTAEEVNIRGHPIADETLRPASIFAIGAGHPNPSRANDPGLIYDIKPHDYVSYLCGKNYTNRQVGILLQGRVNCSLEKSIPEAQLNYPSFSILMGPSPQTYTREVTNVGKAISSYTVQVVSPHGVSVSVRPKTITFTRVNQKAKYLVTFRPTTGGGKSEKNPGKVPEIKQYAQGFLKWVSDQYSVRTSIAIKFTEE